MSGNLSSAEVLRFEIAVNAAAYSSLVAGLREPTPHSVTPRTFKRSVKASVELDLAARSYMVSSLGRHKLPQALAVKPGSRTHNNLSSILASSLRSQEAHEMALLIEAIIEATPTISGDLLQIFRKDIEFQARNPTERGHRPTKTIEIVATVAPSLFLDLDDVPTLVVPERPETLIESAASILKQGAKLLSPLTPHVQSNSVEITASVRLPHVPEVAVDLFMHWGSYEELAPAWQDDPIAVDDMVTCGALSIAHRIHVPHQGRYGATLFMRARGSDESIWLGRFGSDDAHFYISSDDSEVTAERDALFRDVREVATDILALSLKHPHTLALQVETLATRAPHLGLGALLREITEKENEGELVSILAKTIKQSPPTSHIASLLTNYGIGEVVLSTPEGPHAAAGGLAQVISGLPPELCKAGIPVTIIAPLYSYDNGNKHSSAQHILTHGVQLGSDKVRPTYLGSITVNLGPTYHPGTTVHRRAPSALPIKVFLAQSGNLRMFLLSNSSVFDRLYQPVYADEQLRRAIVLSRATLETIATSHFGIRPSVVVSNDWMTACVPAFAALDPHYQQVQWLKECKTVHMIHNGGADYHGRLPTQVNNEDLWPMLNLAPEHFFGFRDPHNAGLINFTIAASQHSTGGILTVSHPYAQQISMPGGGDGIDYILQHKKGSVFGISNGINREEIDRYLSSITEYPQEELQSTPNLLAAKSVVRARMQARYGLAVAPQARLMSFVGRIAEQKGLALLSGFVEGGRRSTLEDLLIRHDDIQILVAGPSSEGDKSARELRQCLDYLTAKYPGRVATHFDYVPHAKALEIIFGSTFFLMPSRFEPGGITQLESLAAGTLVIGRNVGGLSATIKNYNSTTMTGTGFLFNDFTPSALANTADWAITSTRDDEVYAMLVTNARSAKHAWSDRVSAYQAMLQRVILGEAAFHSLTLSGRNQDKLCELTVQ